MTIQSAQLVQLSLMDPPVVHVLIRLMRLAQTYLVIVLPTTVEPTTNLYALVAGTIALLAVPEV